MDNRIFTSHTETRILSKILILCKLKIMASWGYFITPNHWCCSCSFSGSFFIPSIWTILQWRLTEGWRPLKTWRIEIKNFTGFWVWKSHQFRWSLIAAASKTACSSFIPSIWTILQWRLIEGWRPLKTWRIQISLFQINFGWMNEEWIKILGKTWGKIFGVDNIALSGSIFFGVKKNCKRNGL